MRLIVVVEGQTEEAFVKDVLRPHLADHGIGASATIVGRGIAQKRGHQERGGGHFRHWKKDLVRILQGDRSDNLRVTTLFDLYGLPADFPGLDEHGHDPNTARRCDNLQAALAAEFRDRRFIPYIQRHEFEALVLAALPSLLDLLDDEEDLTNVRALQAVVEASSTPEDINDGRNTAPSKRLEACVPGYRKTLYGPLATEAAGLSRLRGLCPRFGQWASDLETRLSCALRLTSCASTAPTAPPWAPSPCRHADGAGARRWPWRRRMWATWVALVWACTGDAATVDGKARWSVDTRERGNGAFGAGARRNARKDASTCVSHARRCSDGSGSPGSHRCRRPGKRPE